MAGGPKKRADAALNAQLAAGVSPSGAAKLAGVSEATAYRRPADPGFGQRVEKARSAFWDRALGIMSKGAAESAIVLRRLLRSDDGRLKLQAAKALLETGMKIRQVVDLTREQPETETVEWTNEERVALLARFFATKWPHLDDGQARELAIRWLIDVQAVGFR